MAEKNSLWKNIRNKAKQNRASGATPKKPTTEMLRQERKIKAQKAEGGPVGDDELYNMRRAVELGYTPDETGHWPSVDSETGMFLKSKEHPTAWMEYLYGYTLNPELNKNTNVVVNPEGYFGNNQLQYIPKKQYGKGSFVGEDGKEPIAFEVTGPTYEVVANNPNGKPKPNWDLPEGFGGYQKMEPSSTSTNVPNIVRVQRDTIDRPEIYKEQQKRLLKKIEDEKQRIIKQANDPNTIGAVKIKDVDSYAQEMAERKIGYYNTPLDEQVSNYATDAAWAMIPEVAPFLNIAKGANKYVNLVDDVNYSKYLTQEEAIAARTERLISQKNKPGWNEQLTPELEQRLSTALERHNPASDYPGHLLGVNTAGRTATEVSKNAISKQGIPLNEANKARIAAHEVGHYYANSPAEGKEWASHFDFSKLPQKSRDYFMGKGWRGRGTDYANEVRERAAQLKDYIAQKNGIPLNQDFIITESMLDDAIANYVKNTGLDNSMSAMLSNLIDKKGLLKTMNKFALGTTPLILTGAGALQNKKEGGFYPTQGPGNGLFKGYAEGGYVNPYNQYATGSVVGEEGVVPTQQEPIAFEVTGPTYEVVADKPDYLKAYDEEYERRMNAQKAFQESWYPGQDYDKTPLENRSIMAANDAAAKIIIERKKSQGNTADKYNNRQEFLKSFNDKEKSIIGNSNLAGYIGPDAGSSFRAALNNINYFGKGFKNTDPDLTQEEANNISRWNIFSPLGVPTNIARAAIMGDDIGGALHGRTPRPWLTSDEVPMGMENVAGINMVGDVGMDPLNLAGMGIGKGISNALKPTRKIAAPSYLAKPVENIANFTLKAKDARDNIVRGAIGSKQLFDQVIGELARGKINKKAIEEGNKYLENWIQNKATQDKIDADIPADIFDNQTMIDPNTSKQYLFNIPELIKKQAKNFKPDSKEYSLLQQFKDNIDQYLGVSKEKSIHQDNWGVSYKHNYDPIERQLIDLGLMTAGNKYGSWVSRINKLSPFKRAGTTLHENVHDWVDYLTMQRSGMQDMVLNNLNPDYLKDFHEWEALHAQGIDPASIMGDYRAFRGYMANPTEMHARTMELRRFFNITPDQFVTDDFAKQMVDYLKHLRNTKKNTQQPITGLGFYLDALDNDPQKVSTVFNKLWGVVPAAVAGTAIPSIGKTNNNQSQATGGYTMKNNNQSWRNYLQYATGGPYDDSLYENELLDKGDKTRNAILKGPLNEGVAPLQAGQDWVRRWTSSPNWPQRLANTLTDTSSSTDIEHLLHGKRDDILQHRKEVALDRYTKGATKIPEQITNAKIMYSSNPVNNELMKQQMLDTFVPEDLKKFNKDQAKDPTRQGFTVYPGDSGGIMHVTNYAGQPGQARPDEVLSHEYGHYLNMPSGTDAMGNTQYEFLDDLYAKKFKTPARENWLLKDGVPEMPNKKEFLPYLWGMRERHGLEEDHTVTEEELQQMRKSGDNNPLFKHYPNNEDLLFYLNEFGEAKPQQQFQPQVQPQVPYEQHASRGGYYAQGGYTNPYNPYHKDPHYQYDGGGGYAWGTFNPNNPPEAPAVQNYAMDPGQIAGQPNVTPEITPNMGGASSGKISSGEIGMIMQAAKIQKGINTGMQKTAQNQLGKKIGDDRAAIAMQGSSKVSQMPVLGVMPMAAPAADMWNLASGKTKTYLKDYNRDKRNQETAMHADLVNASVNAAHGGTISNNSLNLRNTMRNKRFAQGGTFDQFGINFIPESAGLHHESANGGVPIGPNALAEGGEAKLQMADGSQYIVSGKVDGANTQSINGETMTQRLKKKLKPFMMGGLASNPKDKENVRRPFDSYSKEAIDQAANAAVQETEAVRMQKGGALQYAANGGKLNKDIEKIVMEEYAAAYGGKLPNKYKGKVNMPNSYAKGGNIQQAAKQILASKGGYVHNQMTQPMYAEGGPGKKFNTIPIGGVNYTLGESNKKNEPTYPHPVISNNKVMSLIDDMDERWMVDPNDKFDPTWDSYFQHRYVDLNKELNSTDLERVKKAYETAKKERIGGMAGYAQGGPVYGDPASPYTYAYGGMYGDPYYRGGQIDYTNDMYSSYASGGPMVGNAPQAFKGPAAQNRGGMLMTYADGGMVSPEEQMMQQQMMQQQQAPQEQMQQQGGQEQMMQMVQQIAQAIMQGENPEQIMQQLMQSGMPQEQVQQIMQAAMQMAAQQQQQQPMQGQEQMMPPQGMMARGGRMYYGGGRKTNSMYTPPTGETQFMSYDENGNPIYDSSAGSPFTTSGSTNLTKPVTVENLNRLKLPAYSTDNLQLPNNQLADLSKLPSQQYTPFYFDANANPGDETTMPDGTTFDGNVYNTQTPTDHYYSNQDVLTGFSNKYPRNNTSNSVNRNTDTPWFEEPWWSKASRPIQAIPGVIAGITGLINKKRRLDPELMGAQTVSYEPERIIDREESRRALNAGLRMQRNSASNAGMLANNTTNAVLNANKGLAGRIAESVMREANTNAQLAQQTGMTNTGIKNQFKQINEGMFQNAQTQAIAGLQDSTSKLASSAMENRKQNLQEWIARNKLGTRSYKTNINGQDVFVNADGQIYDAKTGTLLSAG